MNKTKQFSYLFVFALTITIICCFTTISATDSNQTTAIEENTGQNQEIQQECTYINTNNGIAENKNDGVQEESENINKNNNIQKDTSKKNKMQTNAKLNNTYNKVKSIKNTQNEYIITNSNYNDYFDDYGFALDDRLENSTVILNGEFENKNFVIYDVAYNISGLDAYLTNSTIEVYKPAIKISNITISNHDNENYAIHLINDNCIIENCTILYNTTNDVKAIYVEGDNSTIQYNTLEIGGPSDEIDWYSDPDLARTLAIAIVSNNNTVKYNNITTYYTISKTEYGAIESITIQGSISGNTAMHNTIEYNNILTNSTDYSYGVNLGQNINNNIVRCNNITTIGDTFADSIQAFSAASYLTITGNNLISMSNNYSDGIAISKDNMVGKTEYILIKDNNISVVGSQSTLIDVGNLNHSTISNNNGNISGGNINGIVFSGTYNRVANNTINVCSYKDTDTGILLTSSLNNTIDNNTIITNTNYTVILEDSYNNTISNNLLANKDSNNNTILNYENNIVANNKYKLLANTGIILSYELNRPLLTINALLISNSSDMVNGGKVAFKINGKTLKDENNQTIYAQAINGTATINYTIPNAWKNKAYNLSAVYSGTSAFNASRSQEDKAIILDTIQNTIITTENITSSSNKTIQLKATVKTTDGNAVTGGVAAFKINGKTVKDEFGNTIYVQVNNGMAILNYTIPSDWKNNEYAISAAYGNSSIYNSSRTASNSTLALEHSLLNTTITADNITANLNQTIELKASICDENENLVTGGNVVFKINGITIKDSSNNPIHAKVKNGIASINYTIPTDWKDSLYYISSTYSGTTNYIPSRTTSDSKIIIANAKK